MSTDQELLVHSNTFLEVCNPQTKTPHILDVDLPVGGVEIGFVIREAIATAKELHCLIRFKFNGRIITVAEDSDPSMIFNAWFWIGKIKEIDIKIVGPYPDAVDFPEVTMSDLCGNR